LYIDYVINIFSHFLFNKKWTLEISLASPAITFIVLQQSQVPQIRPVADIVHFKYADTYLLTYLLNLQKNDKLWKCSEPAWAWSGDVSVKCTSAHLSKLRGPLGQENHPLDHDHLHIQTTLLSLS